MKRTAAGLGVAALVALLAGCGEAQGTRFVIETATPTTSPEENSPAPTASPSAIEPATGGEATPIPGGARIIIDSPDARSIINSPVTVSGTASLPNPTVVVVVLDAAGNELGRASTTATATLPAFGHFETDVDYTGARPGSSGQIKAYGVQADGTTPTWYYFIRIRFG
jgi:hypothetical protein